MNFPKDLAASFEIDEGSGGLSPEILEYSFLFFLYNPLSGVYVGLK